LRKRLLEANRSGLEHRAHSLLAQMQRDDKVADELGAMAR